ncbi:GlcG/HbpS family heme-binding protein [Allosphingosinicella deserti]|uniref:Glycolate utilization protein n=1 Tax=Allosphingosinicella deserti TaxID=2116704 RepID=A0A2P7QZU9_9SPHN|nr:heme-binding protein [Sphingomonas deserti]PSJ43473.1 glycolate utilization protein [Sphingomonas deserti]
MTITQTRCEAAIAAAITEARAIGVPMNIAVLDSSANLKAFLRMDGALLGSVDIALKKARTAALFGMNSEAVGEFCKPGGTSPGLDATNGGLVVFAGGMPLLSPGGSMIGAVGVSGGSVAQDAQVAAAAANTLPEEPICSVLLPTGREAPVMASPSQPSSPS